MSVSKGDARVSRQGGAGATPAVGGVAPAPHSRRERGDGHQDVLVDSFVHINRRYGATLRLAETSKPLVFEAPSRVIPHFAAHRARRAVGSSSSRGRPDDALRDRARRARGGARRRPRVPRRAFPLRDRHPRSRPSRVEPARLGARVLVVASASDSGGFGAGVASSPAASRDPWTTTCPSTERTTASGSSTPRRTCSWWTLS